MPSIRNLLCATLAVGVLLSAPRAEARFGKHSDSSSSSSSSSSSNSSSSGGSGKHGSSSHHHGSSSAVAFFVDLLLDIALNTRPTVAAQVEVAPAPPPPPPVELTPPPPPQPQPQPQPQTQPPPQVRTSTSEPSPLFVRLGVDGAALDTAAGLSAFLGVEGARFGMDTHALALVMPTDDGTEEEDRLTVMNFHLTYAVIAQERARLRLEGGISSAHAPNLTVVAPSVGLSLEAGLAGNLDLELRAQGTAYPFRQVDAQAGLALHLNSVVLRGGWRTLYLNDNGLVDDVVHEDTFGGPYLGAGFAFF